jgi:hypothetical protein
MILLCRFELSQKTFVKCKRVYPFVCLFQAAGFLCQVLAVCLNLQVSRQYLKRRNTVLRQ